MKKLLFFSLWLMAILSACTPNSALFNLETKNFPENSVVSIYSAETGETYSVQNITNSKQSFKINFKKEGYAALRVESAGRNREYWFYIDGGNFDIILDANRNKNYPFITVPNNEGKEFMDFYKIKQLMSSNLMDSLENAQVELDKSTRENVEKKARALDFWMDKRSTNELNVIKVFSKKYPNSQHTLFLLEQLGQVDINTGIYVSIFNGLSNDVKESTAGKDLVTQITRTTRMMAGNTMPNIEGYSPAGESFDKKILKKINLIIVWTSYNTKARENTKLLTDLYKEFKGNDVEFIGVSLDKNRKWWTNVIKDDKMIWPQFSDLKGAKSPNARNLSNYNIPYFFIIDNKGKILMNNDLKPDLIKDEINKLLATKN